jgi:hypothetical protein
MKRTMRLVAHIVSTNMDAWWLVTHIVVWWAGTRAPDNDPSEQHAYPPTSINELARDCCTKIVTKDKGDKMKERCVVGRAHTKKSKENRACMRPVYQQYHKADQAWACGGLTRALDQIVPPPATTSVLIIHVCMWTHALSLFIVGLNSESFSLYTDHRSLNGS